LNSLLIHLRILCRTCWLLMLCSSRRNDLLLGMRKLLHQAVIRQ
jgi:hypothetical protein